MADCRGRESFGSVKPRRGARRGRCVCRGGASADARAGRRSAAAAGRGSLRVSELASSRAGGSEFSKEADASGPRAGLAGTSARPARNL